jgi:hypothetical protein
LREVAAWTGSLALRVYPNPAADWLWIELPDPAEAGWRYALFDAQGRELRQDRIPVDATLRDLDRLPPGLYLLRVTNGRQSGLARWFKE